LSQRKVFEVLKCSFGSKDADDVLGDLNLVGVIANGRHDPNSVALLDLDGLADLVTDTKVVTALADGIKTRDKYLGAVHARLNRNSLFGLKLLRHRLRHRNGVVLHAFGDVLKLGLKRDFLGRTL
jgi:hypothetical protein